MAVSTTILHSTLHGTVNLNLNSDNLCSGGGGGSAAAASCGTDGCSNNNTCRDNGSGLKHVTTTTGADENSYSFLVNGETLTTTMTTTTASPVPAAASIVTMVPHSTTTTTTITPKNHHHSVQLSSSSVCRNALGPTSAFSSNNRPQPSSTTVKNSLKRPRNDNHTNNSPPELMRCKRRINFAQLGYNLPQAQPSAVSRRNERERNRVKLVNLGFATLREHVPNGSKNKKMSKVETLRSAVEYIRKLQELLDDTDDVGSGSHSGDSNGVGVGVDDDKSPYGDASMSGSPSSHVENQPPMLHHGPTATILTTTTTDNSCFSQRSGLPCPPSSVSPTCSLASSPTPSYTSDYSYEPLSPEEEDLLDFTSWFS